MTNEELWESWNEFLEERQKKGKEPNANFEMLSAWSTATLIWFMHRIILKLKEISK